MVSSSDVQLTQVELYCQVVLGTGKNTKLQNPCNHFKLPSFKRVFLYCCV